MTALPACTRPAFDITMSSGQIDAEVRRRLRAGEPLYHVDTDLINSLKPDLLITQEHCEVCAVTPADVERAGCVVAGQVLALQAGSVQGIFDGIAAIGRALGRERDAVALVDAMQAPHGRRSRRGRSTAARRVSSTLEWTDPVFAMGNWGPELVEAANGRLLLGEKGEHLQRHRLAAGARCRPRMADHRAVRFRPGAHDARGADCWKRCRAGPTCKRCGGSQVVLADGNRYFNRSGTTIVRDGRDPGGDPPRISGRPPGQGLGDVLAGPGNGSWSASGMRERCANNLPTYADPVTGYERLHGRFPEARGYCCGNGCRHCPYPDDVKGGGDAEQPGGQAVKMTWVRPGGCRTELRMPNSRFQIPKETNQGES